MGDFTIQSTRVVLPDGERPASIHIHGDRVVGITPPARPELVEGRADVLDFGDLVVSPGIVDTHVHLNDPGRADWEGFDTGTRAAAAGGVTTIVDMPLNSIPPTTTVAALEAKRAAARGQVHVDVGFWGGVVPGNDGELDALVDAGVRGFKCFLVPSGVDEFPCVDENDLRRAMPILARCGVPLLVHAELREYLRDFPRLTHSPYSPYSTYSTYLATRPPAAEVEAIRLIVRLARELGVRTHIVHVSSAEALDEIRSAKSDGVPITAETCPHYLTFAAEDVPDGATEFKCAPPIREASHRSALWDGLNRGVLDLIATDHSPAPPSMKCRGDFLRAWGGIPSLELSLGATWKFGIENLESRMTRSRLAGWMSEQPAALAGLSDRKGRIAEGLDADLVVWDPEAEFTVDANTLQQRHKLSPYDGRRMRGRVVSTFVRGQLVWHDGALATASAGRLL